MKRLILLLLLSFIGYAAPALANSFEGAMTNPVEGELVITSEFGWRIHPITGTARYHSGIDLGVDYDSPIHAAAAGIVTYADWMSGYGNTVMIDHGESVETLYGHNNSVCVVAGQMVAQGQVIALAGSTGNSTGPHCHFEVRLNGEPDDPHKYLAGLPPPSGDGWGYGTDSDYWEFNMDAYVDFGKTISETIQKFGEACTKGLQFIKDDLAWLFFALITIDLALSATGLVLGDTDLGAPGIAKWIFLKVLFYGFLTFMFFHWGDIVANTVRSYFTSMGAIAMGYSEEQAAKIVSDPAWIVEIGAQYVSPIFNYLGTIWGPRALFNIPTILLSIITAFAVLLSFFIIGVMLARAYIEFYVAALFGFMGFAFSGFKGTRDIAANSINGLFVTGMQLMVITVVSLVLVGALKDSAPENYFDTKVTTSASVGGNFANIQQFAAAIKQVETGGSSDPYNTPSEDGYGFGAYQISYSNWDAWCEEAGLTPPPPMPWPPDAQDRVALHHMQVLYDQYGSWEAVARIWNTGSPTAGDGYWQKVCNAGGNTVTKTIDCVILLKMLLVALASLVFSRSDVETIIKEFGQQRFRFKNQGIRSKIL